MSPTKPRHLTRDNAETFQHQTVVDAYPMRTPYPPETFEILSSFIIDQLCAVLDVRTGTGDLARQMVRYVD